LVNRHTTSNPDLPDSEWYNLFSPTKLCQDVSETRKLSRIMESDTLRQVAKHIVGFIFSIALGICGGAVCGAAIVSFGDLIGRTLSTGDHIGNWNVGDLWVGAIYGAPLGALVAPIAYMTLVRRIGIMRAVLPATLGTLAGGFAGCVIIGTPFAVVTGVVGFFIALVWTRTRIATHPTG
jgi:hypothetical protein